MAKKTTKKAARKATKKTAAKKLAPVPSPKTAAPKPPARAVVEAGPTKADYEALQRKCEDLRERGRAVAAERDALEAGSLELAEQNKLLAAGVDPAWNDATVQGAFAVADIDGGVLGACVAVLETQRVAALTEAEHLEEIGEREGSLVAIGAARRLRKVKAHIAEIYHTAKGERPMDRKIRRASAQR